jgi:dethiobiotin synthetase
MQGSSAAIDLGSNGSSPRGIGVAPLAPERLARAKRAFSTRRMETRHMATIVSGAVRPRSGDLVLARVERLGQHQKLELTDGRRAQMHLGDEIVVAYADRYAPDQFESHVPVRLAPTQLVASGGIASEMLSRNRGVRSATDIVPIGLVADHRGQPLNLESGGLTPVTPPSHRPPTIAIVGTSMNAGKTTTAHRIVHSLVKAGHRPGATKVTGTGSGGDYWVMLDAGAHRMLDFTDVGLASTYRVDFPVVERKAIELLDHLTAAGCGALVVEVADGLFQRETAKLMTSEAFRDRIDGVVIAAPDAMGAVGALTHLRRLGLPVTAIAGRITRSPLATREAQAMSDVPILTLDELGEDEKVARLFGATLTPTGERPSARQARPEETFDLVTVEMDLRAELVDVNSGNGHHRVNGHGGPERLEA